MATPTTKFAVPYAGSMHSRFSTGCSKQPWLLCSSTSCDQATSQKQVRTRSTQLKPIWQMKTKAPHLNPCNSRVPHLRRSLIAAKVGILRSPRPRPPYPRSPIAESKFSFLKNLSKIACQDPARPKKSLTRTAPTTSIQKIVGIVVSLNLVK